MPSGPFPAEELLRHRAWVRALARTLVRDEAAADDLAQEAWLAAVETPPARTDAPRSWFARVLRSRAIDSFRASSRRDHRESATARGEAVPSAEETVAQAETHRRVVDAVMALGEPYRTAVLLRFFEDLPPREVARRTGVPVETARSRIRRGVEQLRDRLAPRDDERGRGALLALAAIPRRSAATAGATTGGVLMAVASKHVVGAAAALVVVAVAAHLALRPRAAPEAPPAARDEVAVAASPGRVETPRAARLPDAGTDVAAVAAPALRTRLVVRREDGGRVAGTEFALLDAARVELHGRLGGDATIDAAPSSRARRLLLRPPGAAPRCVDVAPGTCAAEIVIPAGVAVAGRVAIDGGVPRRGVRVGIRLDDPLPGLEDVPEELGEPGAWTGAAIVSDRVASDGTFRVTGLPRGARGTASLPWGYDGPGGLGAEFTAPDESLVLTGARWPHVEGRLVRAGSGEPVAGALVVVAGRSDDSGWSSAARSDDDGTFGIGLRGALGTAARLVVRDANGAPLVESSIDGSLAAGRDLGDVVVPDPWASVARLEVVDEGGRAVRGAVAVFAEESEWASAPSGDDGRIDVPLGGAHRAVVVAAAASRCVEIEAGPTGDVPRRVVLARGASVHVRFGPGGPPPGAVVRLIAPGRIVADRPELRLSDVLDRLLGLTEPSARVRDDVAGQFEWFDAPSAGDVVIGRLVPDVAFRLDAVDAAGAVLGAFDVRPAAGEQRVVTIPIPPLRAWSVRVEDAAGRPVAGAFVEFRAADRPVVAPGDEDRRATGRTGADGRFAVAALAAPSLDVVVSADGFVPRVLRAIPVAPGDSETPERVVRLETGRKLVVRVAGRASAAAGVDTVFARPDGSDPEGPFGLVWEAVRSDDAEWTFDGLPAGSVEVVVRRGADEDRVRAGADAGTVSVVLDEGEE